ncbi:MAG TPA: DinB family protein [Anaerolineae bacterium]|nr:DinB family protein [Anaerolineae bacterium]
MELSERKHVLYDHLNHTREELLEVVGQMQVEDWDKPAQSVDGGWTVKQLLLHVATSENGQIKTAQAIAAGQPTVPDDFDLNRYNARQIEKNKEKKPPEILFGMAESRQRLLAFLEEVPEAALDKSGKHGLGDVITLGQLFLRIGEHEAGHAAEIKRALEPQDLAR